MILCDTNILIEFYKGNSAVIDEMHEIGVPDLAVSVVSSVSYIMEQEINLNWRKCGSIYL